MRQEQLLHFIHLNIISHPQQNAITPRVWHETWKKRNIIPNQANKLRNRQIDCVLFAVLIQSKLFADKGKFQENTVLLTFFDDRFFLMIFHTCTLS